MTRHLWWLPAALLCATANATGYFHHADSLEQLRLAYDRNDPQVRSAYFRGYVAGVADGAHGNAWCPPNTMSAEEIYKVVAQYLKDHPASGEQDAASLVTAALRVSFPCGKQ